MISLLCALALSASTNRPAWTQTIAGYRLVKWKDQRRGLQTLYLKDRFGKVVTKISGNSVSPLFDEDPVRIYHLTGDGVPTVQLETWNGGNDGSQSYFLWKLGPKPKCLLAYIKVVAGAEDDFDVVPPRRGHPAEIHTNYDGFSDLAGARSGFEADLPVLLKLRGDRFVDVTASHPKMLRDCADDMWVSFYEASSQMYHRPSDQREIGMILLSLSDLLGTKAGCWQALRHELPRSDYQWLAKRSTSITKVIRGRSLRCAYPRAYLDTDFDFTEFPTKKLFDSLAK